MRKTLSINQKGENFNIRPKKTNPILWLSKPQDSHGGAVGHGTPSSGKSVLALRSRGEGGSRLLTPILTIIFYFWNLPPRRSQRRSANNQPKSTPANPKSTVDLPLEPLIWVDNTWKTHPLSHSQQPFRSITTRSRNKTNLKQTATNQKNQQSLPLIWVEHPCARAFQLTLKPPA